MKGNLWKVSDLLDETDIRFAQKQFFGDYINSDLDKKLLDTPYEALRFKYDIKSVVFADGTKVSVE